MSLVGCGIGAETQPLKRPPKPPFPRAHAESVLTQCPCLWGRIMLDVCTLSRPDNEVALALPRGTLDISACL